jgi:hypothetical protein
VSEACVSAAGAIVYVVAGLFVFFALVSAVPINGMTDMPHYARTFVCAHPRVLAWLPRVTVFCVRLQTCQSATTLTTSRPCSTFGARLRPRRSSLCTRDTYIVLQCTVL